MKDIFGKEVKRGDIIVITKTSTSGFQSYVTTKLGIVRNIIPEQKYLKGTWKYNRVIKNMIKNNGATLGNPNYSVNHLPAQPDYFPVIEKITFIPFELGGCPYKTTSKGTNVTKVMCSNSFVILDESSLSTDWLATYNLIKQTFKI